MALINEFIWEMGVDSPYRLRIRTKPLARREGQVGTTRLLAEMIMGVGAQLSDRRFSDGRTQPSPAPDDRGHGGPQFVAGDAGDPTSAQKQQPVAVTLEHDP